MKVKLTRKFSDLINGIDLSKAHEGDTIDLPTQDARMLMAEGWALAVPDGAAGRDQAHDKPRRRRVRSRKKR